MVISFLIIYLINIAAFITIYYAGNYDENRIYISYYNNSYQLAFNVGFDEALEYANEINDDENIYVSMCINQPYIYILFDNPISPYEFSKEVEYYPLNTNNQFTEVKKMGIYIFYMEEEADGIYKTNQVYLINKDILNKDIENGYLNKDEIRNMKIFEDFVVFKIM